MTRNLTTFILLVCSTINLFSCKTNLLVLEDLVPRAQQQDFSVSFSQNSLSDFSINLDLSYEITNPYKKALPIPDHAMGILLNDTKTDLYETHEAVVISAKSSKILNYRFHLDNNTLASLMGKNNKITFQTSIELDLTDYSDMLPNYQLSVSEDFDIESSELKPMLDKLLKKQIGTYKVKHEYATYLKVPAPPSISPSDKPIEIALLGSGLNIINPNEIKNAMLPFGDLLVHGKLNGLKDPFIDAILQAEFEFPDPLNPTNTISIPLEEEMLKFIKTVLSDFEMDEKWDDLKEVLYQEVEIDAVGYLVDNFLDEYVDPLANEKWSVFRAAYDSLKDTQFPEQIPGPQTAGFELAIPLSFKNNNDFPINIPLLRSSVFVNGSQPFTMYVKTKNSGQISLDKVPSGLAAIPANYTETLYIVFSFNMKAFNQGIYSLFMKNQFQPNLRGIVSYDFGYGPMYIGYDLEEMNMIYKDR